MTDAPPTWAMKQAMEIALDIRQEFFTIALSASKTLVLPAGHLAVLQKHIAVALSRSQPITDAEVGAATERLRQKFGWPLPQDLVDGVRAALEAVLAYRREHPNG